MEVGGGGGGGGGGRVPKGIRWSAKAGGPPKVRIGGVSGRGRGPTIKGAFYCEGPTPEPTCG